LLAEGIRVNLITGAEKLIFRRSFLPTICLCLISCTSGSITPEQTSLGNYYQVSAKAKLNSSKTDAEIDAFNQGKADPDKIHCRREAVASQIIRKRICMTARQWIDYESTRIRFDSGVKDAIVAH